MSVISKMTAIADKIRSLLGITGTMGLDAMATNLDTEQTNVTNAFTAVKNKGGTVPSSKVSGNLASAIASIPTGVTVQKKAGTFRVDTSGKATVNVGFRPDFLMIHANEADSGDSCYTSAVSFLEDTRYEDSGLKTALGSNDGTYIIYPYDKSSGFGVTISLVTENYQWTNPSTSTTFRYSAVKYT